MEAASLKISAWLRDWPIWWREQSAWRRWLPAGLIALYWATLWLLGKTLPAAGPGADLAGLRTDHINLGVAILALAYAGRLADPLLKFIMPVFLTGVIYDSQRFYADHIRGPIHVTEPYRFDKFFFGIPTDKGILTPNEWWQIHTHPVLDLITGFAYLVFFALFVVVAAYFHFYLSRRGSARLPAAQIGERGKAPIWAFLWLNIIGYSTYYWYAAAPPWYVSEYGLGPAKLDVAASSAGCARFDALLGTRFFSEMYGRAADVFGAIPSLHVAYPFLAMFFAFRFGALRVFCTLFYAVMVFSAVYLNHHYLLDVIWGSAYALVIGWGTDVWYRGRMKMAALRSVGNGSVSGGSARARASFAGSSAHPAPAELLREARAAGPDAPGRSSGRTGF
jgi:inositol phosphorylceramide synthase catalytic subunit